MGKSLGQITFEMLSRADFSVWVHQKPPAAELSGVKNAGGAWAPPQMSMVRTSRDELRGSAF